MKKNAIIITSTSGVDYSNRKNEFYITRLTVHFDGVEYIDHIDITAKEFYEKMLQEPNADIMTSQVSAGVFEKAYEQLKNQGITDVLVVTISSKLSGTYQSAVLAKRDFTGMNIQVFDTRSVSYPELYIAQTALDLFESGLNVDEIVEKLTAIRNQMKMYILVDTLKYLVKNGRLSMTKGLLGTLLRLKPILTISEEGTLLPLEKVRTTAKAQKRILELVIEETKNINVQYFICYTTNIEKALEIKQEITKVKPNADVLVVPLTPVVGAHAGPGTLGLGYVKID